MFRIFCSLVVSILVSAFALQARAAEASGVASADGEQEYRKSIHARADKIVAGLDLAADSAKATRVRDVISQQYFSLREIHDGLASELKTVSEPEKRTEKQARAEEKLRTLHGDFLKKLSKELSSEQVDKVKDGMTYGVVPLTYGVYLKMYPEMKEEEKQQVMAYLVEAREIAMDKGTSNEKHGVFGKYKGKINNYLSKAGYDSKKGAQNLKNQTEKK